MTRTSNRRGFFKVLAGETLRGAHEVAANLPEPVRDGSQRLRARPAPPTQRYVDREELEELIDNCRLSARQAEVQACAITSLRLTPGDAPGKSFLSAGATTSDANGLSLLVHIDLSDIPAGDRSGIDLPQVGSLRLHWALSSKPRGWSTKDAGSAAVVLGGPDQEHWKPVGAEYVRLSQELCLPRAWTRKVSSFNLSAGESDAWERLRRELAARQGVEPFDDANGSGFLSVHRLFGYPDERLGQMPAVCEAAARGIDLGGMPLHECPLHAELDGASERWQLLFQLSRNETFGWQWGPGRERLYVWVAQEELRRGDFSRVWAIAQ